MNRRQLAERRGLRAERVVACWLRLTGWRVLLRRYRTPVGEIDLIARRGRTLAIIEVKAREELGAAFDAVPPSSRRRIERATAYYLAGHPQWGKFSPRFDLIVVRPWRLPRHVKDAWRPDGI